MVSAGDAQRTFHIVLGNESPPATALEREAADANGDGNITAGDAQGTFYCAITDPRCSCQ